MWAHVYPVGCAPWACAPAPDHVKSWSSRGRSDRQKATGLGAGFSGCPTSDGYRPQARTAGTRSKGRKSNGTPPLLRPTECSADAEDVFRQALRRGAVTEPAGMWPTRAPLIRAGAAEGEPRQQAAPAAQPLPIETLAVRGSPATELWRMAKAYGTALMVMSPRRSNDLVHLVRGSVTAHVGCHAPCAVLVLRTFPPQTARHVVQTLMDQHNPTLIPMSITHAARRVTAPA